ncbi:serine hydrolase domain-containing protein [Streptomyces sp. HM190]|uniref:serine hydrolase domain-containing protein n=1 Tax=Streptomyces sp. HM190 TaxID=2695266 RepID=UPI0013584AFB|nr:serine hydrolase domain-containing protein [Streptomyces sp. HM190]
MRVKRLVGTAVGTTLLMFTAVPTASATTSGAPGRPAARDALDRTALRGTLDALHEAGMYGAYSAVREDRDRWRGASGLADVDTGRAVTPDMRHRVGSVSKTFTAVAILQQVERGRISLDAPVTRYVPDLFPGADRQRGDAITVRMLLNHTSHLGDYVLGAFPSLARNSTASLDEHRFRTIRPRELVTLGLAAPATGRPGAQPGSYSNTNYVVAGLILEKVTGRPAATYLTRHVIDRAGLHHTAFPRTPYIEGPHAKMYESFHGLIDPPRDYSVYDMSWGYTAGALTSTMDDLNRFYRQLLTGKLISRASLAEMQRTVPVQVGPGVAVDYGLGVYTLEIPGCGRFWGHDGAVFGAGTLSLTRADGERQLSLGFTLMKYQRVNEEGTELEPSPIDDALNVHVATALCGAPGTGEGAGSQAKPSAGLPELSGPSGGADGSQGVLPEGLVGVDLSTGGQVVGPAGPVPN